MVFDDCASPFVSRLSYRFIVFKSKSNSIRIHRDNFYSTSENSTKLCLIFVIVFSLCYVNFFRSETKSLNPWVSFRPKICLFDQKFCLFDQKFPQNKYLSTNRTKFKTKWIIAELITRNRPNTIRKWLFRNGKKRENYEEIENVQRKRLHPLTKFHSNESRVHDYATATFFSFSWIQYKIF